MEDGQVRQTTGQERRPIVSYVLLEQPRPGNRETRMRERGGEWLQRNQRPQEES